MSDYGNDSRFREFLGSVGSAVWRSVGDISCCCGGGGGSMGGGVKGEWLWALLVEVREE